MRLEYGARGLVEDCRVLGNVGEKGGRLENFRWFFYFRRIRMKWRSEGWLFCVRISSLERFEWKWDGDMIATNLWKIWHFWRMLERREADLNIFDDFFNARRIRRKWKWRGRGVILCARNSSLEWSFEAIRVKWDWDMIVTGNVGENRGGLENFRWIFTFAELWRNRVDGLYWN